MLLSPQPSSSYFGSQSMLHTSTLKLEKPKSKPSLALAFFLRKRLYPSNEVFITSTSGS